MRRSFTFKMSALSECIECKLSRGTISSPTTILIVNFFVNSANCLDMRPPGGEYAMHLKFWYLLLSFSAKITAVPAPKLLPVITN